MTRAIIEKTIRKAIERAAGKPKSQAIAILVDAMEAAQGEDDIFEVSDKPAPEPSIIPVPEAMELSPSTVDRVTHERDKFNKIQELLPINQRTIPKLSEQWKEARTIEEVMADCIGGLPQEVEVKPTGRELQIVLQKSVSVTGTDPNGVQVLYVPKGATQDTPYPKFYVWCNEKDVDLAERVEKVKKDAANMYAKRGPAVSRHTVMSPVENRMTEI